MKAEMKIIVAIFIMSTVFSACRSVEPTRQPTVEEIIAKKAKEENRKKIAKIQKKYFKIPDERILDLGAGTPLYAELKQRYKRDAAELKKLVEATGAKLIFICLTPETGDATKRSKYGTPFIGQVCRQLDIEYLNFNPLVARKSPKEITQWPKDGHWSKKGAEYIADHLEPLIKKHWEASSTVKYKDSERSETFGDFIPGEDEIRDGGKDLPYRVRANMQGVRMDQDITFPKKKKHILFMGDSGIFCPFLDNEFTITGVLQKRLPDAVVMNTGVISYTLEDYITLWNEKAKYSEPDIVFVQTNGGDITDYYFTHRNFTSRSHKPFYPSENEKKFYEKNYSMGL